MKLRYAEPDNQNATLCLLLCWHPGPGHHHLSLRLAPALPASFPTPVTVCSLSAQPVPHTAHRVILNVTRACHSLVSRHTFPENQPPYHSRRDLSTGVTSTIMHLPPIQATCSLRCLKELLYMQTPQPSNSITCLYRTEPYTRIPQMLCSRVFTAALLTAKSTVSIRMDR